MLATPGCPKQNANFQYKIPSKSQPRVGRFQKHRNRNSDAETKVSVSKLDGANMARLL